MDRLKIILQSTDRGRFIAHFEGLDHCFEADTKELAIGKLMLHSYPRPFDLDVFSHDDEKSFADNAVALTEAQKNPSAVESV
jgi:hypothetical protein